MRTLRLLLLTTAAWLPFLAAAQYSPSSPTATDTLAAPVMMGLEGFVNDELNNPMSGVTVMLLGGKIPQICITNARGHYLLQVPSTGGTVSVSFEGYISQQVSFRKVEGIDFVLQPQPGFRRERKERVIYRRHNKALSAYPNQ